MISRMNQPLKLETRSRQTLGVKYHGNGSRMYEPLENGIADVRYAAAMCLVEIDRAISTWMVMRLAGNSEAGTYYTVDSFFGSRR